MTDTNLRRELMPLLTAELDGTATADQHCRLERLLDSSSAARQLYIDYFDLHAHLLVTRSELADGALERQVDVANSAAPQAQQAPAGGSSAVLGFLATAANLSANWLTSPKALAIGILGALATYFVGLMISIAISRSEWRERNPPDRVDPAAPAPARIIADFDSRWHDRVPRADRADVLPAGKSSLASGVVELEFDGGARVRIDGPAEFTPKSSGCLELRGRLVAYVPRQARGFTVKTPTAEVVDLGTEFGVEVDAQGSTDLYVIRGVVDVKPRTDLPAGTVAPKPSAPIRLFAGQSRHISTDGRVSTDAQTNARNFVRRAPAATKAARGPMRDLVDLLAGGDGTGGRRGVAVDVRSGDAGHLEHFYDTCFGDHEYHPTPLSPVLDGCFVPDGQMRVDSAGHTFVFPKTAACTFDHIWADASVPWVRGQATAPLAKKFDEPGDEEHVALWMHCSKGMTFDLAAMRKLWPGEKTASFQAFLTNCIELPGPAYHADAFVLVDGHLRFERRQFTQYDPVEQIVVPLGQSDRYLTLAVTDGDDSNGGDWITFIDPQIELKED